MSTSIARYLIAIGLALTIGSTSSATDQTLYAVDATSDRLYKVDPTTGIVTSITDAPIIGRPTTMAVNPLNGRMYVWADTSAALYEIDPSTGVPSQVPLNGNGRGTLAFTRDGRLFSLGFEGLRHIDLANGVVTPIMQLPIHHAGADGLDNSRIIAAAFDGRLYEINVDVPSMIPIGQVFGLPSESIWGSIALDGHGTLWGSATTSMSMMLFTINLSTMVAENIDFIPRFLQGMGFLLVGPADSDSDGLFDGDEVDFYGTDPLRGDSDGDGWNDLHELLDRGTDPLDSDTDGDGQIEPVDPLPLETDRSVIDQLFSPVPNVRRPLAIPTRLGQTFTVGMHGGLGAMEVCIQKVSGPRFDLTWELREVIGGVPSDSILYGGVVPYDSIRQGQSWVRLELDPVLPVMADEQYTLVLRPTAPLDSASLGWLGHTDGGYARGAAFSKFATDPWLAHGVVADFLFRTYIDPGAGDPDSDDDGLLDVDENAIGTDPFNPDTDGDGLLDGVETNDSCTSPLVADTDGDGLSDGDEVLTIGTDPCNADTDGDGLDDLTDPTPLEPGATGDWLEEESRLLADVISTIPLPAFTGPNDNASAGRQNSLANRLRNAANAIAEDDYESAIDILTGVLDKLDGDPAEPDWMHPSADQQDLADEIALLIALLLLE